MNAPTVAYLGPAGTHTEEALAASATEEVTRVPCATLHETVMAVQDGRTDAAVVPIENSLEGGVAAVLDALAGDAEDVRIIREVVFTIHHQLVGAPGASMETVDEVLSIPHALGQCARFLDSSLPHASRTPVSSTAEAVRAAVKAGSTTAAIGSRLAAELYRGRVLAPDIEDRPDNVTRFVWLARADDAPTTVAAPAKTSIVFWGFADESPGALASVLSELAKEEINLTRIESRPQRVGLGHYRFYADLDGHVGDDNVAAALQALRRRVRELRMLGSYPVWEDVDTL